MVNRIAEILNIKPLMSVVQILDDNYKLIGKFTYYPFSMNNPICPQPECIYVCVNFTYSLLDIEDPEQIKNELRKIYPAYNNASILIQSDD